MALAAFRTRHPRSERATQHLLEHSPGMAALALWVQHVDAPALPFPAATDGRWIDYGPRFDHYPLREQATIVAHEVLHVALRHPQRGAAAAARDRGFDRELWNIAGDMLINESLHGQPWAAVPDDGVRLADLRTIAPLAAAADPRLLTPAAWDIERLYRFLLDHRPAVEALLGRRRRLVMDVRIPDHLDAVQEDAEARAWARRLRQAAAADRPGGLLRSVLTDTRETPTPWERVLRARLVTAAAPATTESWSRPSRRWMPLREQLPWEPGTVPRPTPRLAVCLDSSGSIDDDLFDRFVAELRAIQSRTGARIVVLVSDAAVQDVLDLRHDLRRVRAIRFTGRGGTDFRPALEGAARHRPAIAVYLTDLRGVFPDRAPRFPVVWAVPRHLRPAPPPFGTLLELD